MSEPWLVFLVFYTVVTVLYAWIILKALKGLKGLHKPSGKERSFSLIVPHLGEASEILNLIDSLKSANPRQAWELLVISDHNTASVEDELEQVLRNSKLPARLIFNEGAPGKKQALLAGLKNANYDWILQTDSDCRLNSDFVSCLSAPAKAEKILMGRVTMIAHNWLGKFAALDFMSLQFTGIGLAALGSPIMANGSALAYERDLGWALRNKGAAYSSGDDTFLIQSARAAGYIPGLRWEALATTEAPSKFWSFIEQRIRWGGKSKAYPSELARFVAMLVFLISALQAALPLVAWHKSELLWLALVMPKLLIDFIALRRYTDKAGEWEIFKAYPWVAVFYPYYILLVSVLILVGYRPRWRGRFVKTGEKQPPRAHRSRQDFEKPVNQNAE